MYGLFNVRDMIRTRGLLIRSQTLYPAELRAHISKLQELFYNKKYILSTKKLKNFIINKNKVARSVKQLTKLRFGSIIL